MSIEVVPIGFDPDIEEGDDLAALVSTLAPPLVDGDVIAVTQKVVSKSEGRVVDLGTVVPSARAREMAADHSDPRLVELVLRESRRIVRQRGPLIVAETHRGVVCANAGIDRSNAPGRDMVVLLPQDPDASARRLRLALESRSGTRLAVIIADTVGRAWREGILGIAIGTSGLAPLHGMVGMRDRNGYELTSTVIAVADELAAAADLAFGKLDRVPFVLIRGYTADGDGEAAELIRPAERDLFR